VSKEDREDAQLRQLLGSDLSDTESIRTGTWGRTRKPPGLSNKNLGRQTSWGPRCDDYHTDGAGITDGDDELLESIVKSVSSRTTNPRERKRSNRHSATTDRSARKWPVVQTEAPPFCKYSIHSHSLASLNLKLRELI
jgi:hypothetical protein